MKKIAQQSENFKIHFRFAFVLKMSLCEDQFNYFKESFERKELWALKRRWIINFPL